VTLPDASFRLSDEDFALWLRDGGEIAAEFAV
jgi:hypothetical protein